VEKFIVAVGILRVLPAGGTPHGGGGQDTDPGSSPGTGSAIRGRVFLGEPWGGTGLGEHWGPARQRYLQGPWIPHEEELDRCVHSLCAPGFFHALTIFRLAPFPYYPFCSLVFHSSDNSFAYSSFSSSCNCSLHF
jgi:hypothetical protein